MTTACLKMSKYIIAQTSWDSILPPGQPWRIGRVDCVSPPPLESNVESQLHQFLWRRGEGGPRRVHCDAARFPRTVVSAGESRAAPTGRLSSGSGFCF